MTDLILAGALLAQMAGPMCGGMYGTDPYNAPFTGCVVPNSADPSGPGIRLRQNPLTPAGVEASPARPASLFPPIFPSNPY